MKSVNQNILILILLVGVFVTIKDAFYIQAGIGVIALIMTLLSIICFKKYDEESEEYSKCMILAVVKSISVLAFVISFAMALFSRSVT